MEKHLDLMDGEFLSQLESCSLDPACFSHEAHLRLAWLQLREADFENAIDSVRSKLLNYVAFLNARNKYNETLTVAAVRTVHHFMQKSKSGNFPDFIAEFPRLKTSFRELLAQHYTTDLYHSESARKTYLEPELLPFN